MALSKMGMCARICVNAQRMRDCVPKDDHTYSKSGLTTSETHASKTKKKSTARTARGAETDAIADDDAHSIHVFPRPRMKSSEHTAQSGPS